MAPGETFNAGVLLVTPHNDVFRILKEDCEKQSVWHYPTTYPESHFIKWAMDWISLSQSLNLCPTLTKGQAYTDEWANLRTDEIEIFHFKADAKPFYHFDKRGIDPLWRSAESFPLSLISNVEQRATDSFHAWRKYFILALVMLALDKKRVSWKSLALALLYKPPSFWEEKMKAHLRAMYRTV